MPVCVFAEDLSTVFALAQTNDPVLQASREQQLAEQEATPQAHAEFLPTLDVIAKNNFTQNSKSSITGTPQKNHYNQNTYGLTLTQPIFYYQQWVQLSKASLQVRAANATYAAAEQDLIVRTAQGYFTVLRSADALKFAKAQHKAFAKFLEQTQQRYKVGLIAVTDVQIAKAKQDNAYAQVIAAENKLTNEQEKLAEITGVPISHLQFLRKDLLLSPPDPTELEKWVNTSIEQNFRLQAAQFLTQAAKAEVRLQQGGHMPSLDLNGSVNRSTSNTLAPKNTNSTVGLQITFPLFKGGSVISKSRQAAHLYEKYLKETESLRRQVSSTTRQAYRGVLTQISQVKALKQAIVSNKSALKATEASFNVGTRTIVDVLTSQTSLIQAEQDYANARYDYILESIRLKQTAGILNPKDIEQINDWLLKPNKKKV